MRKTLVFPSWFMRSGGSSLCLGCSGWALIDFATAEKCFLRPSSIFTYAFYAIFYTLPLHLQIEDQKSKSITTKSGKPFNFDSNEMSNRR